MTRVVFVAENPKEIRTVIKRALRMAVKGAREDLTATVVSQAGFPEFDLQDDDVVVGLGVDIGTWPKAPSPKEMTSKGRGLLFVHHAVANAVNCRDNPIDPTVDFIVGKNYFVLDTPKQLRAVEKQLLATEGKPIAIDIETSGDLEVDPFATGHLLSIGIFTGTKYLVVAEEVAETKECASLMKTIFERHFTIVHNGTFDSPFMSQRLGVNLRHSFDTLLAHYVMYPTSTQHGLEPLAVRWLGAKDWKPELKPHLKGGAHYENVPRELLYKYNATDVHWTFHLWRKFEELLDYHGMRKYYEYRMRVSHMLCDIQETGVNVSLPVLDDLRAEYEGKLAAVREKLDVEVSPEFNPSSSQQVIAEFRRRGVNIDSSSKDELIDAQRSGKEVYLVDLLFEHRKYKKVLSSYINVIESLTGEDGKVHPTYLPHGAKTGRLSAKSPAIQTMGRDSGIKRALVAAPGNTIIGCDYSQAELRTVAELSDDEAMIAAFADDAPDFFDDLQTKIYPDLYPTLEKMKEYKELHPKEAKNQRALVKGIVYGSNYGRGAKAIAHAIGQPVKDAQRVMDQYYATYPNLKKWQDAARASVHTHNADGALTTRFGLKFEHEIITFRNSNKVENEALAFVPQSTANDICLNAALEIHSRVGQYGANIVGLVHDAIYVECPKETANECGAMMEHHMTKAAELVFHKVKFVAEADYHDSWEE